MFKLLKQIITGLIILLLVTLLGFRLNAWWQETNLAVDIAPANGQFVETPLGKMHISIWGKKTGQPVLMTHGMAAWGGLWKETAIYLAGNGYRVIAIDQPPFGFSDRDNPDFSRSSQAKRIDALVTSLKINNYFLVGHSYGGGVAAEVALRYPDAISGLVLICPVMVLNKTEGPVTPDSIPLPLRFTPLAEALVSLTITNPLLTGFLTKQLMHKKASLTDEHIKILQKPVSLKGNTKNMVLWLRQFLQGDPKAISRDRQKLAKMKMPVSLIWGESDHVTPINQGEELAGILNLTKFTRIKNVGHLPQLEAPQEFNDILLRSIKTVKANNPQANSQYTLRGSFE